MGLAASQARLLSLTARQHTVEGRAQYYQAQKLRLANDSDRLYEKYVDALDATSLQTKTYDSNGKVRWIDGSFNNLMRYDASQKDLGNVYYVQDINDSKLYMPQKIVDAYDSSGNDVFMFLDNLGISYQKNCHTPEYTDAHDIVLQYENIGYNVLPFDSAGMNQYNKLKYQLNSPTPSTSAYFSAEIISNLISASKVSLDLYTPANADKYNVLMAELNNLKSTRYYSGDVKSIIDYCLSFNVSEIFDKTYDEANVTSDIEPIRDVNRMNTTITATNSSGTYISYDENAEKEKQSQSIDNLMKLKMLLNGGDWKKVHSMSYKVFGSARNTLVETTGSIYNDSIKSTLNSYGGDSTSNIGIALTTISRSIMESESQDAYNNAVAAMDSFLASKGTTKSEVEGQILKYELYQDAVNRLSTLDQGTYTKYDDQALGYYYEDMFNAINSAGGCKVINDSNAKSANWVNNMIKNAQVVLATYNRDKNEIDNVTASSNTGLREISNDAQIAIADSEYETALNEINSKETKYNTKLNQLESERNAIQTEIESLKQVAEDNISSTFKLFS